MADISLLVHQIADNINRPFDDMLKARLERMITSAWATLIKRDFDKYGRFSANVIYELNPIETESVNANPTLASRSLAKNSKIKRTKIKLPKPLKMRSESSYLYFGNVNRTEAYSYCTIDEYEHIVKGTRFARLKPHYALIEQYGYILGEFPKFVSARFVPSDPFEVLKLKETGVNCVDGFDIDETMEEGIKALVYNELRFSTAEEREVEIDE